MSKTRTVVITKSDTVDLDEPIDRLFIGTTGHVDAIVCGDPDGVVSVFQNLANASWLNVPLRRIMAATTAGGMIGIAENSWRANPKTLTVSGTPETTGTKDTPLTGFTVTALHGRAPYTYAVHAGTLPAGVTCNATTGVVGGTPTVAGAQAGIVIRATDHLGSTADLGAYTLTIAA